MTVAVVAQKPKKTLAGGHFSENGIKYEPRTEAMLMSSFAVQQEHTAKTETTTTTTTPNMAAKLSHQFASIHLLGVKVINFLRLPAQKGGQDGPDGTRQQRTKHACQKKKNDRYSIKKSVPARWKTDNRL